MLTRLRWDRTPRALGGRGEGGEAAEEHGGAPRHHTARAGTSVQWKHTAAGAEMSVCWRARTRARLAVAFVRRVATTEMMRTTEDVGIRRVQWSLAVTTCPLCRQYLRPKKN